MVYQDILGSDFTSKVDSIPYSKGMLPEVRKTHLDETFNVFQEKASILSSEYAKLKNDQAGKYMSNTDLKEVFNMLKEKFESLEQKINALDTANNSDDTTRIEMYASLMDTYTNILEEYAALIQNFADTLSKVQRATEDILVDSVL